MTRNLKTKGFSSPLVWWLLVFGIMLGITGCAYAQTLCAVTYSTTPASSQPINTDIVLKATAIGGTGVQYQFEKGIFADPDDTSETWTTLQAWSVNDTYTWKPTTAGSYTIRVLAREGGSGSWTTKAEATYIITPAPPTAVTLVGAPVSPQPVNTKVTLTATATGGTNVQYKFENGTTVLQDWSSDNTFDWTPTTAAKYTLKVSAREQGLPAVVVQKTLAYTITPALTAVAFTVNPVAPQPINKAINITATATGGAQVQYKYEVGTGTDTITWVTKQDYQTSNKYAWTPATGANYSLRVTAREGTDSSTAKVSAVAQYLVTTTPPTAVTLTPSPVSPQAINKKITLTAAATGAGTGSTPEYKFEVGTTKLQDWSTDATYDWTPTTAGAYVLKVSCREKGLPATVVTKTLNYTITEVVSAAALAVNPVAPQPINKAITLTGSATGGANVQYKFEIGTGTDTITWTTKQAYSSAATCTWTPTTAANYSLRVSAREGTDDSSAKTSTVATYLITTTPPTAVTLTPSPVSAQPVNTKVTLTAAATGAGTGATPEYKFEVGTTKLQDWSTDATVDWTPTTAGAYVLKVSARQQGLPATVVTKTLNYTITAAVSAAAFTVNPVAPQPMNKAITITASATGGANVQFKFEVGTGKDDITWTTKQAYSSAKTCAWTPSAADTYSLRVTAREGTDDTSAKASAVSTYLITTTPPTAVTLTPSPVSPQPVSTEITLTAAATGAGTGSTPEYKFEVAGTMVQDWSTTATYKWTPTTAGTYALKVSAREKGLPATVVTKTLNYTITAALSAAAFTVNPAAPKAINSSITLTASATGGANVQFKFEAGTGTDTITWTTIQDYSATKTYAWKPATAANYSLRVTAREGTDSSTAKASAIATYVVSPAAPTAVSLTPSPVSPQDTGKEITLTAAATGGTNVEYKFEIGGTMVQDYSTKTTYKWTPTSAGVVALKVYAREVELPATVVNKSVNFTVTQPASLSTVTLAASPAAPKAANTKITLTATATGSSLQYKFEVGTDDGSGTITYASKRDWNSAATYDWTPDTAGRYFLKVSAREGDSGTPVVSTPSTYVVMGDMVVTGAFTNFFYVQAITGTAWGTRIGSTDTVHVGDKLTAVTGSMDQTNGGEDFIVATATTVTGTATVPDAIEMATPQVVVNAVAAKVGVLVVTHGTVISTDTNEMVISDGKGGDPLTVVGPINSAAEGDAVDVTGIICLDTDGSNILLTRTNADVVVTPAG